MRSVECIDPTYDRIAGIQMRQNLVDDIAATTNSACGEYTTTLASNVRAIRLRWPKTEVFDLTNL